MRVRSIPTILMLGMGGLRASPAFGSPAGNDATAHVRVKNIGLHIGGGPNDAATKAPFLKQIALHFDEFGQCYGLVEARSAHGTFGIDLLVPKEGGAAVTSNPRTSLKGAAFRDCVVNVFASVNFDKPRRGATKLSYALSFEPE